MTLHKKTVEYVLNVGYVRSKKTGSVVVYNGINARAASTDFKTKDGTCVSANIYGTSTHEASRH